jgi:hypothetical protein
MQNFPSTLPSCDIMGVDQAARSPFCIAQVQAVFVKQGNLTQHSRTVSVDHTGDSRQNFVQGCTEEDHLQRIVHRIAGRGLRGGWGCWKRLQVG